MKRNAKTWPSHFILKAIIYRPTSAYFTLFSILFISIQRACREMARMKERSFLYEQNV